MKIAKFGGSSLATAEQIKKVGQIIADDPDRRIVVVSAPGKRHSGDTKVTDLLIAVAEARLGGATGEAELEAVLDRYAEIGRDLGVPQAAIDVIAADLRGRLESDTSDPDLYTDNLKASGEDNCAKLFAQALVTDFGLDAHYMGPKDAGLLLSEEYGNAQVLPESYDNLARALADEPGVTVFPGFFGYTPSGDIATLPRGGSDITGAILAAAVKADLYENFTDVDSVFSTNRGSAANPKPITHLTYHEMRELAYAGFAVFHDEAILPAVHANIPVCIKNTNRPEAPGTMIVPERDHTAGEVTGITGNDGFCSVFIEKYLMNRELGFGRRLLQILEEDGISFQHMPSGIDNLSVILEEESFGPAIEKDVLERVNAQLEPDRIEVEHGLALVMIVGEGMSHALGVAGRATTALAKGGVNIEMINQGSSEISMMFGVKSDGSDAAVRALHAAFMEE